LDYLENFDRCQIRNLAGNRAPKFENSPTDKNPPSITGPPKSPINLTKKLIQKIEALKSSF
jgi:hypothetical protein